MDSYDDFTPSSKGSSKLASLFGRSKEPVDNPSLTYTAPKQPKKETSPQKKLGPDTGASNAKLEVIVAKTIHAYKLLNGAYQPLGQMGLTLVGCKSPSVYQLLLYKTREDVLCKVRLNQIFSFNILDNNYASFYTEDQQNYSVMFDNAEDLQTFVWQLAIVKSCTMPLTAILTQDVKFSKGPALINGSSTTAQITCHKLVDDKSEPIGITKSEKITVGSENGEPWMRALQGMKEGGERIVIAPKELSDPWKEHLDADAKLLVHIKISQPAVETAEVPFVGVKPETLFDSSVESADESSSFKEKGAMIEGVLGGKSHKSGLLSRVARLGQATLPLRGAVVADLTDSEEDSSPSPKPRTRPKPTVAGRDSVARAIPKVQPVQQDLRRDVGQPLVQPIAQPLALYQPQTPYHAHILMRNDSSMYAPLVAANTSNLPSPSDANLSIHFSESRTQATELRMGLAKVADKVDLVLNKIQDIHVGGPQQPSIHPVVPAMDPTGLLTSVQALVQENMSLKGKVEEQKTKIDTQNERIYHLLELSHKSLEQNSATFKQAGEDEKLVKESVHLKEGLNKVQNEVVTLNAELIERCQKIQELEQINLSLNSRVSSLESEGVITKNELQASQEKGDTLKRQLELLEEEMEKNKIEKMELSDEVDTLKKCANEQLTGANEELVLELENARKENELLKKEALKNETELRDIRNKLLESEGLLIENERLKEAVNDKESELSKVRTQLSQTAENNEVMNTKVLMNELYRNLHSRFNIDDKYTGAVIKEILASVIRDMTLDFLERNNSTTSIQTQKTVGTVANPPKLDENPSSTTGKRVGAVESPEVSSRNEDEGTSSNRVKANDKTAVTEIPMDKNGVLSEVGVGSSSNSPETKSDTSTSSLSMTSPVDPLPPQRNEPGEQSFNDFSLDSPTSAVIQRNRETEASYNQIWHTNQPPPLPAFDDDDDDKNVW